MKDEEPVLIDEERASTTWMTWRAVGSGASEQLRRRIFYDVNEAIAGTRAEGGNEGRPIRLCPLTTRGQETAAKAAETNPGVEVTGFQVWITEGTPTGVRWFIYYFGGRTQRRRRGTAKTIEEAMARIRRRRPGCPVRVVTRTPEGERETGNAMESPNTVRARQEPAFP